MSSNRCFFCNTNALQNEKVLLSPTCCFFCTPFFGYTIANLLLFFVPHFRDFLRVFLSYTCQPVAFHAGYFWGPPLRRKMIRSAHNFGGGFDNWFSVFWIIGFDVGFDNWFSGCFGYLVRGGPCLSAENRPKTAQIRAVLSASCFCSFSPF